MAALIIAIFPQNSSRGNREEQQDRTDPNSRFELARKPAWLLAFRQFGLPKWKPDFESFSLRPLRYISIINLIQYSKKAGCRQHFSPCAVQKRGAAARIVSTQFKVALHKNAGRCTKSCATACGRASKVRR